ncbi:hypothetical protein [Caldimonas sp. KR1-144]|uniref:hypothetical protein n=1 Tax=Caldimonas sp. KR1-144 TaxID=3400911 RepID=UPI003C0A67F6
MTTDRPTPALTLPVMKNGIQYNEPAIRVCCLTLDGATMTVPAKHWKDVVHEIVDEDEEGCGETSYTLAFKTMLMKDYEALGEFDGF